MFGHDLQQSLGMGTPENAELSHDKPVEIISEELSRLGVSWLQQRYHDTFEDPDDVSLVPVMNGGCRVGEALAAVYGQRINSMQMTNYASNGARLDQPRCIRPPDLRQIVRRDRTTKAVAFAEAVIESQGTINGAIEIINGGIDRASEGMRVPIEYPKYYLFVLVSKIDGPLMIPELVMEPAFAVNRKIWVYGWGCDNNGLGREVPRIMGLLSPKEESAPERPYFQRLF